MTSLRLLVPMVLASVVACSSSSDDGSATPPVVPPAVDAAPPEEVVPKAVFGTCPKSYGDACAQIDVPLDHQNPAGETIKLHIARKRAAVAPAKRQLWLLSGGPGQGGDSWFGVPELLAPSLADTDIFVVDHRGTGYSHRLTCAKQDLDESSGGYYLAPIFVKECLAELKKKGDYDRLKFFTTRQAAGDVIRAIKATRNDEKVFLWGASYGTHWAHRIMQLAPTLASGIVFDGFVAPNRMSFAFDVDKSVDEAGKIFAAACTANASCRERMGGDALVKLNETLAGLDKKPCLGGKKAAWRAGISSLVDRWGTRAMIFPLVHRLARCSAEDEIAINTMTKKLNAAASGGGAALETPSVTDTLRASGILQYNIIYSDLWNVSGKPDPTRAQIVAAVEQQTFLYGKESLAAELWDVRQSWPLPPADGADLPVPVEDTTTKMAWLAGEMDPRTPLGQAKRVTEIYDPASLVILPGATHTPVFGAPMKGDAAKGCGMQILQRFVGEEVLDASCAKDILPVVFEAPTAEFARTWWGTDDDWGDGKPKPAAKPGERDRPLIVNEPSQRWFRPRTMQDGVDLLNARD